MEAYADKRNEANYQIIQDGHKILMRLFEQKKSGNFLKKLPSLTRGVSRKLLLKDIFK